MPVCYNSVFLQWINTYCIKYTKIQWFCANLGSENSEANVLNHKNDHLFPICMTIMMLSSTSWSGKWECLSTRGKKKNLARIFEWLHANITTPLEQSNGKRIFLSCQRLFPFVDSQWPLCYHNLYCPNTTAVLNVWVRVQSWDMKCLQALKIPDTHTPASFPSLIPQPHSQVAPSFAARSVWSCDIKMLTVLTLRLHMYS